ncbi:MAG: ArgR family transcriptional regulator [Acidobacteria bacterium]|nr:ArgR family transcriptional regulator [Acidobacteriota bacterium]
MNKSYRHAQILKVVAAGGIHTQQELAAELETRGVPATQVTLSRDIRELGLAKTPGGYQRLVQSPPRPDLATVAAEFLVEARVAQNLVVLKTPPGSANPLAAALDRAEWTEIIGTVAGDDTVLVIAPNARAAAQVGRRLLKMVES